VNQRKKPLKSICLMAPMLNCNQILKNSLFTVPQMCLLLHVGRVTNISRENYLHLNKKKNLTFHPSNTFPARQLCTAIHTHIQVREQRLLLLLDLFKKILLNAKFLESENHSSSVFQSSVRYLVPKHSSLG
jgi:hypothetical protein